MQFDCPLAPTTLSNLVHFKWMVWEIHGSNRFTPWFLQGVAEMSVAQMSKTFGCDLENTVFSLKIALSLPHLPLGTAGQRYVVSVDGSDPFIRWQLERGLDWTISSVAGESYRVEVRMDDSLISLITLTYDFLCFLKVCLFLFLLLLRGQIDLAELLETCAICSPPVNVSPAWTNASFTLKYSSDALFDFAHWLGFSRRSFKVSEVQFA